MPNFMNADEIKRVYYPERVELVKAEGRAKRVGVFDHTPRTADDAVREEHKIREPVRRAHNDYTEWSGPQRVRDILPDEAEAAQAPLRHYPDVAADPLSGRDAPACHRRRTLGVVRRLHSFGAPLSEPDRPDLRHRLQPEAPVVLAAAPGARGGAGVQGLRLGQGRPRPLDGPHRLRRSHHAAARTPPRKHRNPHAGVFLTGCYQSRVRREARLKKCRKPTRKANATRPTSRRRRRDFS